MADHSNNTYYSSIGKNVIDSDYSALSEEIELSHKALKFKDGGRVWIMKYKNIFSKGYMENWSREIFAIDSVLKINPWTIKFKNLNSEKIIELIIKRVDIKLNWVNYK